MDARFEQCLPNWLLGGCSLSQKMLPNSDKVSQGVQSCRGSVQSCQGSVQNGAIEDNRGSHYLQKNTRKATKIMQKGSQEVKNYNYSSLPVNVPINT